MNDETRKKFKETLFSLEGIDSKKDRDLLNKAIIFPKYIYRFRTVDERTLDALRENKLYFSTSNYYDDLFDTFINIDIRKIKDVLDDTTQIKDVEQIASCMDYMLSKWLGIKINAKQRRMLIETLNINFQNPNFKIGIKEYWKNIRNEIKKETWSVCFSEDG